MKMAQKKSIGIIDYGAGNFLSVERAFRKLGVEPLRVTPSTRATIRELTHLVFPGVGRAAQAMTAIQESGLSEGILAHAKQGKPLLGICVGMQLLGKYSAEDETAGLGLLDFSLAHLRDMGVKAVVPHMGWNELDFRGWSPNALQQQGHCTSRILANDFVSSMDRKDVYFVHSYAAPTGSVGAAGADIVVAQTVYDGVPFAAIVGKENILGTQFHVEKSGQVGLDILNAFIAMEA
jgi:glutamine amidotransferase